MDDSAQRRRPNKRIFDGRIEKRLPTSVPVYLGSLEDPSTPERTFTENVSPHGARVISRRNWRPGEEPLITPLNGERPQVGRVIYCLPKTGDRFCLGVEFPDRTVNWGELSSASTDLRTPSACSSPRRRSSSIWSAVSVKSLPTEKIISPSAVCIGKPTAIPCCRSSRTALTMSSARSAKLLTTNSEPTSLRNRRSQSRGQRRSAHRFLITSPPAWG